MSRVVSQILSATDIYVCRLYHTGPGRKLKREGVQHDMAEVWKTCLLFRAPNCVYKAVVAIQRTGRELNRFDAWRRNLSYWSDDLLTFLSRSRKHRTTEKTETELFSY